MRPHLFKIVAMLAALTALTAGARAQSVTRAHVPFNFSVNNTTIAAGDCVISRINGVTIMVSSLAKDGDRVFVMTNTSSKPNPSGDSKWIFHRYGDSYFLAGMSTPNFDLSVPQSRTEKTLRKELRLASISKDHPSPIKPEVLAINVTN